MWYQFTQNNSAGYFQDPAEYVFIEADNANQANDLAEHHDIYFDGVAKDVDCDCCGDRWHEVDESDSTEVPTMYVMIKRHGPPKQGQRDGVYRYSEAIDLPTSKRKTFTYEELAGGTVTDSYLGDYGRIPYVMVVPKTP